MDALPDILALILCGGKSSRMGSDKALLHYHDCPQYQYLINLCQEQAIPAFISCRAQQQGLFPKGLNTILDAAPYEESGPMGALLSAAEIFPEKAILLLGCDYPNVQAETIQTLLQGFHAHKLTVAMYHPENQLYEPLLAIYHPSAMDSIRNRFKQNQQSLQKYLLENEVTRLEPIPYNCLKSFDTPEDFQSFTAH